VRSTTSREHFPIGASLSDEGVHVLDPFAGTGTFIARMLQTGLIRPEDLDRKYRSELHSNEVMLLAYYIAAINIETVYEDSPEVSTSRSTHRPDRHLPALGGRRSHGRDLLSEKTTNAPTARKVSTSAYHRQPAYSARALRERRQQELKYPTLDRSIELSYAHDPARPISTAV